MDFPYARPILEFEELSSSGGGGARACRHVASAAFTPLDFDVLFSGGCSDTRAILQLKELLGGGCSGARACRHVASAAFSALDFEVLILELEELFGGACGGARARHHVASAASWSQLAGLETKFRSQTNLETKFRFQILRRLHSRGGARFYPDRQFPHGSGFPRASFSVAAAVVRCSWISSSMLRRKSCESKKAVIGLHVSDLLICWLCA